VECITHTKARLSTRESTTVPFNTRESTTQSASRVPSHLYTCFSPVHLLLEFRITCTPASHLYTCFSSSVSPVHLLLTCTPASRVPYHLYTCTLPESCTLHAARCTLHAARCTLPEYHRARVYKAASTGALRPVTMCLCEHAGQAASKDMLARQPPKAPCEHTPDTSLQELRSLNAWAA
jgi:hypothetical protein